MPLKLASGNMLGKGDACLLRPAALWDRKIFKPCPLLLIFKILRPTKAKIPMDHLKPLLQN